MCAALSTARRGPGSLVRSVEAVRCCIACVWVATSVCRLSAAGGQRRNQRPAMRAPSSGPVATERAKHRASNVHHLPLPLRVWPAECIQDFLPMGGCDPVTLRPPPPWPSGPARPLSPLAASSECSLFPTGAELDPIFGAPLALGRLLPLSRCCYPLKSSDFGPTCRCAKLPLRARFPTSHPRSGHRPTYQIWVSAGWGRTMSGPGGVRCKVRTLSDI